MKCPICNIGDLHYCDDVIDFNILKFWIKPKTLQFLFVCDYCGRIKKISNELNKQGGKNDN